LPKLSVPPRGKTIHRTQTCFRAASSMDPLPVVDLAQRICQHWIICRRVKLFHVGKVNGVLDVVGSFCKGRWYWSGHRKNSQLAIDPATGTIAIQTIALTLTDTVTVIFFTRISLTPMKSWYRNNEINFRRGAVAGFVGGPFFSVFWLFTHLLIRIR